MPTHILLIGTGLSFSIILLQILIWWSYRINSAMWVLGVLFFCLPTAGFILLCALGLIPIGDGVGSLLIHFLLASAYVQSYPAFQENIPSFKILLFLRETPHKGVSEHTIVKELATDELFTYKLRDLVDDGLIVENDELLELTRAGRILSLFFAKYRDWLGLESGIG